MKEKDFQAKLRKQLKARGCLVFNLAGNMYTGSGIPDLYVQHPNWGGWIELKVDRNKLTPLQSAFLKELGHKGANSLKATYYNSDGRIEINKFTREGIGKPFFCESIEEFVTMLLRNRG